MKIHINNTTCSKCGKCVKECPALIFTQTKIGDPIGLVNEDSCYACGHCVAVCSSNSVDHELFTSTKIHPIDYNQMPTPEQVMLLCKARRSNRSFSSKPIPTDSLNMILEAAHRAPTASNMEEVEFTEITNLDQIRLISQFTIDTFSSLVKKATNPLLQPIFKRLMPDDFKYIPVFNHLKQEFTKGNDLILRNATAVILIHSKKKYHFGLIDSNLAYQNASLMAESLGVSQFYTGFVYSATRQKKGALEKLLGIDGVIHAGMALGMTTFRYPNYMDKKDIVVKRL